MIFRGLPQRLTNKLLQSESCLLPWPTVVHSPLHLFQTRICSDRTSELRSLKQSLGLSLLINGSGPLFHEEPSNLRIISKSSVTDLIEDDCPTGVREWVLCHCQKNSGILAFLFPLLSQMGVGKRNCFLW